MRADFNVVLDACVLANYSVCDLFLRLAETPRLYLPKLEEIARKRNCSLEDHLIELGRFLPAFSQRILEDVNEAT